MKEVIAILVKGREEFNKVQKKALKSGAKWTDTGDKFYDAPDAIFKATEHSDLYIVLSKNVLSWSGKEELFTADIDAFKIIINADNYLKE